MNAPVVYHVPRPRLLLVHDARKAASDRDSWREVHRRISQLGKDRAAHERELCKGLLEAERLGVHARLGYASFREYAERVVGLSARQCEERLRVGRALEHLPQMEQALAGGDLCWSVVRELTRVATAENESAWLEWARGRRASEVAAAVAERKTGAEPESPAEPSLVRHRLSFEVRAETMALFRELQAMVRRDLGGGDGSGGKTIDDDTLLFEIARRALAEATSSAEASPDPAAVPSRESSASRPNSERADTSAPSREGAVDAGQPSAILSTREPSQPSGHSSSACRNTAHASVPSREGTTDAGRPHYQIAVTRCPSCGDTSIEAGGRTHRLEPEVAEMIDCDAQIIGAVDSRDPLAGATVHSTKAQGPQKPEKEKDHGLQRATQTIPPATRRAVIRRHHGRCAVPGCRHYQFLDVHHVTPRSEGGTHDPDQLVVLCGAHHRAHHRGHLRITGSARAGFRFFHADGTPYGNTVEPARHEIARRVLLALTGLGFRRKEAEQRLRAVQQARSAAPEADFETLLRAALAV